MTLQCEHHPILLTTFPSGLSMDVAVTAVQRTSLDYGAYWQLQNVG